MLSYKDVFTVTTFHRYRSFAHEHSYCGPFIPYVGEKYGSGLLPKFAYCGVAAAWPNHKLEAAENYHFKADWANDVVLQRRVNSAFWRLCWDTLELLDTDARFSPEERLQHMAWTNLSKLGSAKQTAPPDNDIALREMDAAQLRHEIEVLAPDLLLCVSGSRLRATAAAVFGKLEAGDLTPMIEPTHVTRLPSGGLLYRTMHPQYKTKQWQRVVRSDLKTIMGELIRSGRCC